MVVRELINMIGWKVNKKQLSDAEKKTQKFMGSLKKIGLAVGAGIVAIGVAAINAAMDMESLIAQFEVMLGSAEKAQVLIKDLQEFSARTPFQLTDLARNTQMMLSFGIAAEDVMDNLQMLGDIAGKDREKLNSLTLAFSQIQSTGRLMGQDLLQLINAGFNPLMILSEQSGKSMKVLKDEMSKGLITAEMVADAFRIATSEGGLFFRNMEKQSKTLGGLISTLRDNISLVLIEIGNKMLPFLKEIVQQITVLFQGSLGEMIKNILDTITPLLQSAFGIINTLFEILMPIVKSLMDILKPIISILDAILPLVNEIIKVMGEGIGDIIADFAKLFVPLLEETAVLLKELVPLLMPILRIMMKMSLFFVKLNILTSTFFFRLFIKGATLVMKLLAPIVKLLNLILIPAFELLEKILDRITGFVEKFILKIISGFTKVMEWIFGLVNNVIQAINNIPFIKEKLKPLDAEDITRSIKGEVIKTGDKITNLQMQNQFTFNGDTRDKTGIKKAVQQAVGTPFQIEIKKIIADI
jgi:tape measure domain-containing protein